MRIGDAGAERERGVDRAPPAGVGPTQVPRRLRREGARASVRRRAAAKRAAGARPVARRATRSRRGQPGWLTRAPRAPVPEAQAGQAARAPVAGRALAHGTRPRSRAAKGRAPPARRLGRRAASQQATSRPGAFRRLGLCPPKRRGAPTLAWCLLAGARPARRRARPNASVTPSRYARVGVPPVSHRLLLSVLAEHSQGHRSPAERRPARDSPRGSPASTTPSR
jgi:hypothetical protein